MVWVGGQASRVGVRVEAVARVVKRGAETDVPVGGVAEEPVVRELVVSDIVAVGLVVAGLGAGAYGSPPWQFAPAGAAGRAARDRWTQTGCLFSLTREL